MHLVWDHVFVPWVVVLPASFGEEVVTRPQRAQLVKGLAEFVAVWVVLICAVPFIRALAYLLS